MGADASLIFDAKKKGPTTHVLIVGVGWYPHLPGGGKKQVADPQGLSQLTSPNASARALASWFLAKDGFVNRERPLSTLRLLTSEKKPKPFVNPKTAATLVPEQATFAALKTAIDGWYRAGDASPLNLMIFYYCGHGLGSEAAMTLLAQDFGADPTNILDTALDFSGFRRGMKQCKARQQVYFVDACRSRSDILVYSAQFAGQPVKVASATTELKQQPVFWSTRFDAEAQGTKNKPSYYTETLIAALRGLGAERTSGSWQVSTGALALALPHEMLRRNLPQLPPADDVTPFAIADVPVDPKVPVSVICDPEAARPSMKLSCSLATAVIKAETKPGAGPWQLELAALPDVSYSFSAKALAPKFRDSSAVESIRPPGQIIRLKVAK